MGVDRKAEQPAIDEVVDVAAEVDVPGRRRVREAVVFVDDAGLLRDEDLAVRREPDRRRRHESAVNRCVREPGRECRIRRSELRDGIRGEGIGPEAGGLARDGEEKATRKDEGRGEGRTTHQANLCPRVHAGYWPIV